MKLNSDCNSVCVCNVYIYIYCCMYVCNKNDDANYYSYDYGKHIDHQISKLIKSIIVDQ